MDRDAASNAIRSRQDLTRVMLAVLFIGGLLVAGFLGRPAVPSGNHLGHDAGHRHLAADDLGAATCPGNAGAAVLVMTLALLLVLIVPLGLAVSTVVAISIRSAICARTILSLRVPPPPDWLAGVPLLGARAAEAWGKLTSAGVQELAPRLIPTPAR